MDRRSQVPSCADRIRELLERLANPLFYRALGLLLQQAGRFVQLM
ncbi:hypothetical protein X747_23305 [Mesorhizobium sp. LNJC384A00]|nr:hypothetical protein X771_24575 [Mesorhizobium sp. LSJC277A00]ESX23547.1 hypothetical protein X767_14730 [Mesorhizobium sp. LSJC264A00]ESX80061.1 hypothetical protein X757_04870 [Mesorhizobium sp. LSHC414A00]ESY15752.1 hypothetical protein X750_27300 [Mesorhizobium sp. LNJC394B00]ESY17047.1 hypothetical protein X749_31280 [Mesorhizobium sp. LNJC391B00]ESY39685.1 hypothetical protein X747_23305 [Mesorhizobium sp. LNJC384A00]ESZ36520.1 hypothetical protein X732_23475 [Mesorhizobium sp. L2C06